MQDYKFDQMFELSEEPKGQLEATAKKIDAIAQQARKCVNHGDFITYKNMFDSELDNIMNAMVIYTANFGKSGSDNLEIYAINMIRFVQRITDLRKLLTYVENDARKSIQQKDTENGEE